MTLTDRAYLARLARGRSLLILALSFGCVAGQDGAVDTAGLPGRVAQREVKIADSVVMATPPLPVPLDSTATSPDVDSIEALADSLSLTIPVDGVMPWELRDTFGDPRVGHAHEALDIMAPRGTPVLSAANGRVTKLHTSVRGGIMVYASDATDRYVLMYGHLDRYAEGLIEGMSLRSGQLIGYVGSTGDAVASGPHLHFAIGRGRPSEAWWKGDPVNPYPLLFRPK